MLWSSSSSTTNLSRFCVAAFGNTARLFISSTAMSSLQEVTVDMILVQ